MADPETLKRAKRDAAQGKAPSTQAGEFVREEIRHIREGKHGARSPQQAIAIGLSKARRSGVELPVPPPGSASEDVRRKARADLRRGQAKGEVDVSSVRSRAIKKALMREKRSAASPEELARQARRVAGKRKAAARRKAAKKETSILGKGAMKRGARRAARTRERAA